MSYPPKTGRNSETPHRVNELHVVRVRASVSLNVPVGRKTRNQDFGFLTAMTRARPKEKYRLNDFGES